MDGRKTLALAGLLLALATLCGALGAHALKGQLSADRLEVYDTAVRYHFCSSLGLLGIGLALRSAETRLLRWSAVLVFLGVVLFSGSLYALTFGAPHLVGVMTPVGGLALIAGWLLFALGFLRLR
jgi:uncharacterized membrane protein YgdD (TMEM256/DUF423 family)